MYGINPAILGAAGAAAGGAGGSNLTDYGTPEAVWTAASLAGGGDPTVAWADDTGNGNDVTGDDGGGGTSYSATGFDGTHGVTMGPTLNDALVIPTIAMGSAYTLLVFWTVTSDSAFMGHLTNNVQVRRDRSGGNNYSMYGGTAERISNASSADHTAVHMSVFEFDGAGVRYQNNEEELTLASADGTPGTMTFNRLFRTQSFLKLNGSVGQIGLWKSALGKTTCDDIYNNVGKPIYTSLP